MASGTSPPESIRTRWTYDEVFTMLATLNSNIEGISCEFQTDKREGVLFAANLLSEAVGTGCTPERVISKLKLLWNTAGPENGNNQPGALYLHGAWTRTLPHLDQLYPEMLESLSKAGMNEQRDTSILSRSRSPHYSLRRTRKDEESDPYDCRCEYFHYASSSVHCSRCYTWQHVWCYYNTDDMSQAPDDHTCDKCRLNPDSPLDSEKDLQQAMADLEIRRDFVPMEHGAFQSVTFDHAPNGDFYGLDDKELYLKARSVTSAIEVIAHSLNNEHFELGQLSARALQDQPDVSNSFNILGIDISDKAIFLPTEQKNLLKSVLAVSFWKWTCYSRENANSSDIPSNLVEAISYARTQIIIEPGEQKAIRSLHYKAWNYLAIDRPELLKPIVSRESEELTERLFRLLSVLLKRKDYTGGESSLRTAEDWIHHTPYGRSRARHINQLFSRCINLRNLFAMSEYQYELYFPRFADMRFMLLNPADLDKKVKYCFMPAILEFEPDPSRKVKWGLTDVTGSQRFINADLERRQQSRSLYPAMVKF